MTRASIKRTPRFLRRAAEKRYAPAANLAAPGFTAAMTVPSVAGIMVTPQTALTFTAFFAAIKVISEDLASLPLLEFQGLPNGGCTVRPYSDISRLFDWSMENEAPAMNARESFYSHALSWGNGYAEIDWSDDGRPLTATLIHPSVIAPKRDQDTGRFFYELQTADSIVGPRGRKAIPPWKILHLAGLGFNGLVGYSPVSLAREAIGLGKATEQYGASFFGNGAQPSGVVEFKRAMKAEALKNFREMWNLIHQGPAGAHKIALLEEGATWKSIGVPPEDAQFLATRAFQVLEICRIYRLPPHKLADFTSASYSNVEAANEDYIISCLRPWAVRLEKAINFRLIGWDGTLAGRYVKHDFRPLLLRTAKDQADFYQKLFQIGIYSIDEIKALMGENPIGAAAGGAKRFVMSNLQDVAHPEAGHPGAAKQQPAPKGEPGRPEGS